MLEKLQQLTGKDEKYVIGLMSGTSVDGIDAALVKISGNYTATAVETIAFETFPYSDDIRTRIFRLFEDDTSSSRDICHMNFLLGELFANAAINIAKKAGIPMEKVDLIGSHGQTIYHMPEPVDGIKATLQIGEGAVIAHKTGAVTVSDFRVADMAAGGTGAPLVPYTEFLLYASSGQNIALQNIGGIGNITAIPKNVAAGHIIAFDTGPGNMVIDFLMKKTTGHDYDKNGDMAAKGSVCGQTLAQLMDDPFIKKPPPKATGREYYGKRFSEKLYVQCKAKGMADADIIATVTAFTAESIRYAVTHFVPFALDQLVVGGGGAYNQTLVSMIATVLPGVHVTTHEKLGKNSDAKEAIAFAILANETIHGNTGNLPQVTGASAAKILGKISI
jgi:anhydro-N-acetylmuramic acid kinase